MTTISLIAAKARNGVIGHNNQLPWQLPEDLQHFRRTTLHHPVIMGRKTFESIGKPLPKRQNIIVSGQGIESVPADVIVCPTLEDALRLCVGQPKVFIMGGAQLYAYALPACDEMIITEIDCDVTGDAYFPSIEWSEWQETQRESAISYNHTPPLRYAFVTYRRK